MLLWDSVLFVYFIQSFLLVEILAKDIGDTVFQLNAKQALRLFGSTAGGMAYMIKRDSGGLLANPILKRLPFKIFNPRLITEVFIDAFGNSAQGHRFLSNGNKCLAI